MKKKKEKLIMVVSLFALVLVTIGISYAAFTYIGQGQRENTITTGNLTFVYDESNKSGNGISIDNATPTTDAIGSVAREQGNVFEFTVTASTKGAPIYYEIYVTKQDSSTLPEKVVKTYLTTVQGEEETGVPNTLTNETINTYNKLGISQVPDQENGRTLYQEMIPEGQANYTKTFRYRMWISDTATEVDENGVWKYNNMSFTVKVNVYASNEEIGLPSEPPCADPTKYPQYVDKSGANQPVLLQGQIPVVYNECASTWVKADLDKSYDYSTQNWANVVTVKETGTKTREEYMHAPVGTPISMDDINTMWVWIPRYEYMYTNLGNQYAGGTQAQPGEIKVNFIEGTGTTPSDSTNYKVHPAFTFGSDELEGIWYAKFETSTTDSTCNSSAETALAYNYQDRTANANAFKNCDKVMTNLQVKPNVSSWRWANVSNFFYSSRNMQLLYAPTYGFSQTDSDLHMSKNNEWGAVAYLSQSKYGKYGNPNYEGANKEIYQNKSSSYITGSSNGTPSTSTTTAQVSYDVEKNGTGASTTGNITGIYDMSGGSSEYVMGDYDEYIAGSGFGIFPDSKYYDLYTTDVATTACSDGICYGHALSETSGWYSDRTSFVYSSNPWFYRGGDDSNSNAGVFSSGADGATGHANYTFRFVQVPLK